MAAQRPGSSVTNLLVSWRHGRGSALEELMQRVYPELRSMARRHFRGERADHSLSPTVVVHEVYLRLIDAAQVDWQDRRHFFAMSATLMRRVLVEHARARHRLKRRGVRVTLDEDAAAGSPFDVEVLALHAALEKLATLGHAMEAEVVQLKFFGGLSIEEIAAHLSVSDATIVRAWRFARTWLHRELTRGAAS
ncbi:MAG: ECF-type sigma factor [Acidobacteriota bacterium]